MQRLYLCVMKTLAFLDHRRVRQGITLLFLSGTLACIFPPSHPFFQWWAAHAFFITMAFLLIGLLFLTINRTRLMFVCLGCSAVISFFKAEMENKSPAPSIPINEPAHSSARPICPAFFYLPVIHEPAQTDC